MDNLIQALTLAKKNNRLVVLAGNGGSLINALHFELHLQELGIRAIALNNSGVLTARSNDYGMEAMFAKPLLAIAQNKDFFMAISGSGSSLNILAAVAQAHKKGIDTIGLSFTKNSPLLKAVSYPVYVPSPNMGSFEDDCSILSHQLKDYL